MPVCSPNTRKRCSNSNDTTCSAQSNCGEGLHFSAFDSFMNQNCSGQLPFLESLKMTCVYIYLQDCVYVYLCVQKMAVPTFSLLPVSHGGLLHVHVCTVTTFACQCMACVCMSIHLCACVHALVYLWVYMYVVMYSLLFVYVCISYDFCPL